MSMTDKVGGERRIPSAAWLICVAGLLLPTSGCGTDTYVKVYETRMSDLQRTSAFAPLSGLPTDDLPVNFRVPSGSNPNKAIFFTQAFSLFSADTVDATKHIASDRVLPPFMQDGVGFRRCYEGQYAENAQVKTPYYLYVWMFDAPRPKDGLNQLRDFLRGKLGDPKADWEQVEAKTPKGGTLTWKRLHFKSEGKFSFEVNRNGTLQDETPPFIFELWYCETPTYDVLLGWRASVDSWEKAKEGDFKLQDLPEIVAGTLDMPASGIRNTKPVPTTGPAIWARRGTASSPPKMSGNPGGQGTTPPTGSTPPEGQTPPTGQTPDAAGQTPGGTGPAADNKGSIRIATAAGWTGKYSIDRPSGIGWSQDGTADLFHVPGNPYGPLPEYFAIELRTMPNTGMAPLIARTQNEFSQGLEGAQLTWQSEEVFDGMRGECREITGKENGHPRKMLLYFLNKGNVFVIMQGLFNDGAYASMRVHFQKYARSLKVEAGPPNTQPAAANPPAGGNAAAGTAWTVAPESERHHNPTQKFSIRFPAGWEAKATSDVSFATYTGNSADPDLFGVNIVSHVIPDPTAGATLKQMVDLYVAAGATNPPGPTDPSGPYQLVERGEMTIDGQPAVYLALACMRDGQPRVAVEYLVRKNGQIGGIRYSVPQSKYDKFKDLVKQCAATFQFDADAGGPAPSPAPPPGVVGPGAPPAGSPPAAAAPPPKAAGPVALEFPDKTAATIEFPPGFTNTGHAPEASTTPPMGAAPAAAVPPDTIKIQTQKLGAGVLFNDLHKTTATTELQSAPGGKFFDKGTCTISGATGDYWVVEVAGQGASPPRKRITYLANVTSKKIAVKIVADVADANYKTLKEELKKCVRSLKIE